MRETRTGPHSWFRRAVWRQLEQLTTGQLTVTDCGGVRQFGPAESGGLQASVTVRDPRFYATAVLGGALGAAESYLRGDWDSPDLTAAMRVLAQNARLLEGLDSGVARWLRPFRAARNWLRRNTPAGSRRNIAAHYDLGNEFFSLMLDSTMTYSCGIFDSPDATLEEASREKYDRSCRKLQLNRSDHVLEIGGGWGGFAEHAARLYGCQVTTTTISQEQFAYARRRFRQAGIDCQVTLLQEDYRNLRGQFDKLVSIEMIEAVGEQYLPGYFARCSQLLQPHGMMALQSITIPDSRYAAYRQSVDFIQRYIFPGGFLPSLGAIGDGVSRHTDFRLVHAEDFGPHYAMTLKCWRRNFWRQLPAVKALGFDDRFLRTWHYYLCYCEAGFEERQIGVSQLVFAKPECRRDPILGRL